ncbi:MAG: RagB/SusD family nutrient uptake outer membrane protein [Bacteroidales bacterium]|nr:RagB/SusD family nutrient uptake outer membrane protein [Bacteroidales bacterium]
MKNKIILLGILFSITFSSCTDWLDPKPLDTMVMEDFWQTNDDVESMVLACYEAMTKEGFMQCMIIGSEVRSDNVTKGPNEPGDNNSLEDILNVTIQTDNKYASWYDFYRVINYCNSVIRYAPGVQDLDPDYTNGRLGIHLAEAKAIRALVYFYLVRIYKDVPFVTEPFIDDTQKFDVPKMDGDSILTLLVDDLLDAERSALISRGNYIYNNFYASDTKGRFNKNSVRTLLADIYLWLGRYSECIEMCDKVLANEITEEQYNSQEQQSTFTGAELYLISNNRYSGTGASDSYMFIFSPMYTINDRSGNSAESIFELQFTTNNDGRYAVKDLYGSSESTRWLNVSTLNDWSVFNSTGTDLRQKDFYYSDPQNTNEPSRILKYVGQRISGTGANLMPEFTSRTTPANWIFYRLPDVILMKAEALVELGDENLREAFDLVNRIYKRANPTVQEGLAFASYNSKQEMRKLVLLERQREFLFEGKRWFDLIRFARREGTTRTILSDYLSRNYTFNSDIIISKLSDINAFYMPIHRDELVVNPSLVQNPYYINDLQEGGGSGIDDNDNNDNNDSEE